MGKFTFSGDNNLLENIFKLKEINKKIEDLLSLEEIIKEKIIEISNKRCEDNMSIDINNLKYLTCISCQGELKLKEGNIKDNKIIDVSTFIISSINIIFDVSIDSSIPNIVSKEYYKFYYYFYYS